MPIALRSDFDAVLTRAAARKSKDGPQTRRLLSLAAIYEGASRTEAVRIGGVTVQVIRDWVVKFNVTGPEGLLDRKAPGQPSRLNAMHGGALFEAIEKGPTPAKHGVVRWRIIDLMKLLSDDFSISISKPTLSRELRALGYRQAVGTAQAPCARPGRDHRVQKGGFAAALDTVRAGLPSDTPIEIWFQSLPRT